MNKLIDKEKVQNGQLSYIKDRLEEKLSSWQGKLLSGAGKDLLIRVVAQALPSYAMSVFRLSQNFCEDLEQMCARFWWGSSLDHKKIHWKRWNILCNAKETGGLGFRSLSTFNSAMLAKQAWRIVANPESLIARIYKARYYPENSFWDAPAHYSPSFSWRSISGTRQLVQQNSFWQVGDGASIMIFHDRWIPGSISGKPVMSELAYNAVSRVGELLLEQGSWDVAKVQSLFPPEEAALILNIPLSSRQVADRICWSLEKTGTFSVKSIYRFAFLTSSLHSPIENSVGSDFWKKLWKTKIPNKAKVHVWRVCLDILPSLGSLLTKRVPLESILCVLCEKESESTLHLCRDCDFTKSVLQTNAILKSACYRWGRVHGSALEWLSQCAQELSLAYFGELLFLLWSVWKERNDRVWDQKVSGAVDVSISSHAMLYAFRLYNSDSVSKPKVQRLVKWKAPPTGFCKINVDGAFNNVTKSGGLGFVIRDCTGMVLAGGAYPRQGLISAEHAELLACVMAVEFAIDHHFYPAFVEMDAQVVLSQLEITDCPNTGLLGRIYEDLQIKLVTQGCWKFCYINRSGNTAAHVTAAYAASLHSAEFFFSVPNFLQAVTTAELCVT